MSLAAITRFTVTADVVAATESQLRKAGRSGHETFVLWSGSICDGVRFAVRTAHVPRQTSYRLEGGLCVRVEGKALHKLNVWLYEQNELLCAQIHAHPHEAFHSETDDRYPIVTCDGGLSLVAADFCGDGLLSATSALFRLTDRQWLQHPLSVIEVG